MTAAGDMSLRAVGMVLAITSSTRAYRVYFKGLQIRRARGSILPRTVWCALFVLAFCCNGSSNYAAPRRPWKNLRKPMHVFPGGNIGLWGPNGDNKCG
eukprot:CAMPEP_0184538402 /NCGR_PEP_ID=MMETSP0198_2-20121128/17571_1 /TAXON_ID=1112570 /ORGANISM="Thraustochytrium sp., Strain LLF1b" /LENGTH=97 /DNA_ID=CAMNT_0026931843 /DNA_START=46 /DNA_END=339 /DNA_ORIENTATION=+